MPRSERGPGGRRSPLAVDWRAWIMLAWVAWFGLAYGKMVVARRPEAISALAARLIGPR